MNFPFFDQFLFNVRIYSLVWKKVLYEINNDMDMSKGGGFGYTLP
jgi:hypothetical protein